MAVTLGYSSLLVQQSLFCRVVGLSSGSTCAHFAFHRTISPSNTVLSVKSGSNVLKILSVVSGFSRWIFNCGDKVLPKESVMVFQQPFVEFFQQVIDQS